MTSQWTRWRLKSPASRLFTQPFIQTQIQENIKAPRHWPLCGEFTGDRWIPRTNGQWRGNCLHLMTSSCETSNDLLPDGTQPLLEPMFVYRQKSSCIHLKAISRGVCIHTSHTYITKQCLNLLRFWLTYPLVATNCRSANGNNESEKIDGDWLGDQNDNNVVNY